MFTRLTHVLLALTAATSLALAGCTTAPTATQAPATAPVATLAPPIPTPLPATNTAAPTAAPAPAPTTAPVVAPRVLTLPVQWDGVYKQVGHGNSPISLIIDQMNGVAFSGRMVWGATSKDRGAITKINGQFATDFGDAVEQAKWSVVPGYVNAGTSGTWIKWTETSLVQGKGYTLGGWYYGHIGEDGTATGIYYLSDRPSSLLADSWQLNTK